MDSKPKGRRRKRRSSGGEGELDTKSSYFQVTLNYLISEQTKKQEALKIGIFTVFLVVMIIAMLKSVVDSAPILFVKLGQESAGAFDFRMVSPMASNAMRVGDVNYYAVNPWHNPFCKDCVKDPDEVKSNVRYYGQSIDNIETTDEIGKLGDDESGHEFPDDPPPPLPAAPEFLG